MITGANYQNQVPIEARGKREGRNFQTPNVYATTDHRDASIPRPTAVLSTGDLHCL